MKRRLFAAIERFAIRHGLLATTEESAYYAWADSRLDELAAEVSLIQQMRAFGIPYGPDVCDDCGWSASNGHDLTVEH